MFDITQFEKAWVGKYTNDGGGTLQSGTEDQCVDLIHQWEDVNHWPHTTGNAISYAEGKPGWKLVKNTPEGIPPAGSIVVFAEGQYGHVALALPGCTTTRCLVLQQNAPLAGTLTHPGSPVNVGAYNYVSPKCICWLEKE